MIPLTRRQFIGASAVGAAASARSHAAPDRPHTMVNMHSCRKLEYFFISIIFYKCQKPSLSPQKNHELACFANRYHS